MVTTKEYTFQNVTEGHTISAEFDNMVTINLRVTSADVGNCKLRYKVGSASTWTEITSPTTAGTDVTVPVQGSITVECYDISTGKVFDKLNILTSSGVSRDVTDNPHTESSIIYNMQFTFTLKTASHTIVASAGTGGSISPSGNVSVEHGASQTFTITANSGYIIKQILVDGSPIPL